MASAHLLIYICHWWQFLTASLVPLYDFEESKLWMSINGKLTFKINICGDIPDGANELRDSFGLLTTGPSSITVSTDLYLR